MHGIDPERLLELLRDPNVESGEIAALAGVAREEAGRAARVVHGIARAKSEEVASLAAPLAAAVARAAIGGGRADLLAALAVHGDRGVAKEARRGLHVLKTRGVAVPEPSRPSAAPPPRVEEPPLPAFASAIDGRGERAVWIPRNVPGRGIEVGQAVISDVAGLLELQIGVLGRKEYRAFVKGLFDRGGAMALAELERERAKALVAAARARNDAKATRVPDGADRWLSALGPATPLPDPADRFPPLDPESERAAIAESAKLHELPPLRSWLADETLLRELAARLDEISVSPLYVDERQRADGVADAIARAVDRVLEGERRELLAARLFDVADHLSRSGDEPSARSAAAVARTIHGGAAPGDVPFVRGLVEKAFPPATTAEPTAPAVPAPASPGGLIVAPR
jgi:hypothetical protein